MLLTVTTVFLLMIQNVESERVFFVPVGNPTKADVIRKRWAYNPKADVIRQYRVDMLVVSIDSTGIVVSMSFVPIPNTQFTARSRILVEPPRVLGGYSAVIRNRYERAKKIYDSKEE